MKNKKAKTLCKKSISLLLTLLLVLTAVPLGGLTAFAAISGDFEYSILSEEDKTCEITKYTGSATTLGIPSKLDGYTVTSIGYGAFSNCTALTKINIPDSVIYIEDGAFYGCTAFTDISVAVNNPVYNSLDGVLFDKIQGELIQYPVGKTATIYTVPSITAVQSIIIPKSIQETAFGEYIFANYPNLKTIYSYSGTMAEAFAQAFGYTFIPLDVTETENGITVEFSPENPPAMSTALQVTQINDTDVQQTYDITLDSPSRIRDKGAVKCTICRGVHPAPAEVR